MQINKTARILVVSRNFPGKLDPTLGAPVKARMSEVAKSVPVIVLAPQAWSPIDWMIRLVRKSFRPVHDAYEVVDSIQVFRPKYFALPRLFKGLDGPAMAFFSKRLFSNLCREFKPTVVDSHFVYPDGYAAVKLAKGAGLPVTITLRGSADTDLFVTDRSSDVKWALSHASRVFSVSRSLKLAVEELMKENAPDVKVISNGIDAKLFYPIDRSAARDKLGVPAKAKILIGVGSLYELKGFHRLIDCLPALRTRLGDVRLLIVGGGMTTGDMTEQLKHQAAQLGLSDFVVFTGPKRPAELNQYYSAADLFVSATAYEGWANVLLEAMACGLPCVTTRVGGNSEVVCDESLGYLVEFWKAEEFINVVHRALEQHWDVSVIRQYALDQTWEKRASELIEQFSSLSAAQEKT